MMTPVRYFVFHRGGDWLVTLDGTPLARHRSRPAALGSAIVMADLMGAMHHDADVMVEEGNELVVAWTHGIDPMPQMLPPAAHRPDEPLASPMGAA